MSNLTTARHKVTNPFRKYTKNGIRLLVDRPVPTGRASLKPTNPYVKKYGPNFIVLPPGRPSSDDKREPTKTRSIRLSVKIWALVEAQAKREGISTNAAMKIAAMIYLKS